MGEGWKTAAYLLLGLGLVAALYYAVTQITARQRRLEADLTRLERLSAEVAMSAEAILERVDERIAQLQALADQVEAKVAARVEEESPSVSAPPATEAAATPPGPGEYEAVRAAVFAMADAGREPHEIAEAVGVPRGEVQLILNLRGRKATV